MLRRKKDIKENKLMFGPAVPKWYDGDCSIPGRLGKILLDADQGKDACVIHDWVYFMIALLYEPETVQWHMNLHLADAMLRWNLVLLRKRRWVGKLWGWVYYKGLRMPVIGSRRAVNRFPKFYPRQPRTKAELLETVEAAKRFNDGELTELARETLAFYASKMLLDIRKELKT